MILDTMKNKELYYKLGEGFKKGFEFIEKCKKERIEVGKYEIDGKNHYLTGGLFKGVCRLIEIR